MVSVEFNGATYEGRLEEIRAHTESFCSPDGIITYRNYLYDVTIMDALGAIIKLQIKDLKSIIAL